jgi:photosystem II stability/assembly factor-like uncharacterized protein
MIFAESKNLFAEWEKHDMQIDNIAAFVNIDNELLIFNSNGKIYHYDIDGSNLKQIYSNNWIVQSASINIEDIYVTIASSDGLSASIFKSTDKGNNWFEFIPNFGNNVVIITDYEFIGKDTCFFVGLDFTQNRSIIISTFDGGKNINSNSLPNTRIIYSISNSDNTLFVGTHEGKVFFSKDYGATWNQVSYFTVNNTSEIREIKFHDNIGIAINSSGDIFRSSDYGTNWEKVNSPISGTYAFYQIKIFEDNIYISGKNQLSNTGILLHSQDLGNTWNILFENDNGIRGIFVYNSYLYCLAHHNDLWWTDLKNVSVDEEVSEIESDYLAFVTNDGLIKTNIYDFIGDFKHLKVYDVMGNTINTDKISITENEPLTISIGQELTSGVYFILVNERDKRKLVKFIVLNSQTN